MHRPFLIAAATISFLLACGEPAAPPATPADGAKAAPASSGSSAPPATADATIAKEGEPCGDGTAGRPKAVCADGLVCELNVTAATPGKCRKK